MIDILLIVAFIVIAIVVWFLPDHPFDCLRIPLLFGCFIMIMAVMVWMKEHY